MASWILGEVVLIGIVLWTSAVWLLMIILPNHEQTHRILRGPFTTILPHMLWHTYLLLPTILSRFQDFAHAVTSMGLGGVLTGLQNLLVNAGDTNNTQVLLVHLLAFNLFVGRWVFFDGRNKLNAVILALVLLAIMTTGPAGLGIYFLILQFQNRR
jgi:hypothetical protein